MKTKIISAALFFFTAIAVACYPFMNSAKAITPIITPTDNTVINPTIDPITNQRPKIEAVFVLDTTGSMSGLIQAAKEKIWSIANNMASAQPAPEIKIGLVAYRDRGDRYITQVIDLSSDLDSMYAQLMDFQADGGGDGPESVNQALYEAVNNISWSQNQDSYKVIFLVGDAPPHMDYQDDVKYPKTLALATQLGIVVNSIQCGSDDQTTAIWEHLAVLGKGHYFQVEQSGNAVAIATPFDEKIASLSAELDGTRLYYGNKEEKAKQQTKILATEKLHAESSTAAQARRGVFNSTDSGKTNFTGDKELVDDIANGRVQLSAIDKDALPDAIKVMPSDKQQSFINDQIEKRNGIQTEIKQLAKQRNDYIAKKVKDSGGAKDSLDEKLYSTIREQAKTKGLKYNTETAPVY